MNRYRIKPVQFDDEVLKALIEVEPTDVESTKQGANQIQMQFPSLYAYLPIKEPTR